jgi:hypothetical protein
VREKQRAARGCARACESLPSRDTYRKPSRRGLEAVGASVSEAREVARWRAFGSDQQLRQCVITAGSS